ncbi:TIGR01777 family oxidoreductase [Marinobacter fonticola]|uniref:TIGR01777 family oxidoreductase n=1 Tax=Marinobacter fonticola TaxID=2603215 RepID=UPI0011E6B683|nr:TIGR01777 family oxidoreductase [Marinobacter fonticola]
MTQHILVTGGTGFIGQRLCPELLTKGYRLTVLSRQSEADVKARCGRVEAVNQLSEISRLPRLNAVINLAGEGIAESRWTEKRKQELRDSRIALTRQLMEQLQSREQQPEVIVSGSAVGYYGSHGGEPLNEDGPVKDEFTHHLCADWESEALRARDWGARVALSRTGIVLGPDGGALGKMLLPFKLGLGGRLGDGQQYMPWIHREDVVKALIWMLESPEASGAYNVVSPHPVRNVDFTRTLGRVLGRPTIIPLPAFALKAGLGEMSTLLLDGQRAMPEKLYQAGFDFKYPELEDALRAIV